MTTNFGSFWMIISSFFFAFMGFFVKKSSNFFSFQEIVFWRMFISTLILIVYSKIKKFSFKTSYLKQHIYRGSIGTLSLIIYFYTITNLPLATAVTLSYTSVLWMILFSVVFLKQHSSIIINLGAIIGFIGVIFLLNPSYSSGIDSKVLTGILTGVLSAWAYIQVKELTMLKEPEWRIVFYFSLIGAIITGIWSSFTGFHYMTFHNMIYIIAMAISALIGQLTLTLAYSKGNVFISAILSYLTILFSFLLGFFILNDKLKINEIIGIVLILLSGFLSKIFNKRNK